MFSYYGAKTNVVKLYPKPKEDKIIEPFAGSARYSLEYFEKEVHLVDKYEVIVRIWQWLQKCTEKDILGLPRHIKFGQKIDDVMNGDCQEAKWLIGFLFGSGPERPRLTPPSRKAIERPNHLNYGIKRVAGNLYKIRHWRIEQGSYEDIKNVRATWFIDPPYQFGGHSYVHGNKVIDFKSLSRWCIEREGQVIVCENTKADWMDFRPIKLQRGSVYSTTEAIWTNEKTIYDNQQLQLL